MGTVRTVPADGQVAVLSLTSADTAYALYRGLAANHGLDQSRCDMTDKNVRLLRREACKPGSLDVVVKSVSAAARLVRETIWGRAATR